MNTKIRNVITPLLLISSFYINASLNQVIDVIGALQGSGASNVAIPPIPAAAKSLTQFVLPFGDAINQLWFSPVFEYNQQQWAAQLPFHNARSVFKQINAAAIQGHTIQFKFQSAEDDKGNITGLITAIDLSNNTVFEIFTFDNFSEYLVTNTQTTQKIPAQASLVGLNITYQPVNGKQVVQGIPLNNNIYSFAIVPGAAAPQIATDILTLRSNSITNLTVVALNGQSTPATYFNNAWNAITTAIANNQQLNFTIGQKNITCDNNVPTTPLLSSATQYLVVAEDETGYISAAITNKHFSVRVNNSLPATQKSNIILPASQNPMKAFMMLTTTGNQGSYQGYAYLPNVLSAGAEWMNVFNALKSNISMTTPLEVTMSGNTVTLSYSGGTVTTLNLTNTNQTPAPYILIMQDSNGNYHYATMDADGKIIIQVKS